MKLIQDNLRVKPNTNTAKNAILFMGDGMGITTVTSSRILDGQLKGKTGEENVLSWEEFPWTALVKTYAVDQQGPDSASSATAFLSGVKTDQGKQKRYRLIINKAHFDWESYNQKKIDRNVQLEEMKTLQVGSEDEK